MANYSREDAEKQGNVELGVAGALIAGIAALIGKAIKTREEKEQIEMEIYEVDREIDECKQGVLGRWLNADRISELEERRQELANAYNKKRK